MLKYIKSGMLIALLPAFFTGCKHNELVVPDARESYRPAGDFVKNNYDLQLFNAALEYTGLATELNGEGPFTLFAPNNNAFNELGITRISDFQRLNKDSLKLAMQYHILNRRLPLTDMPTNGVDVRYMNLAGREVYLTLASMDPKSPGFALNNLFVNGSFAVKKNVVLSNGILNVMDKVIKYIPGSVQQFLAAKPEYSVYVAALKQSGLWEQLSGAGPFTIFAPDNAALERQGITMETLSTYNAEKYVTARLFGMYILPGKNLFLTDFIALNTIYGTPQLQAKIANDNFIYRLTATKNLSQVTPSEFSLAYQDPENPALGSQGTVYGNTSRKNDNLTDNGIVHYLPDLVIKPKVALKK
ncbi:fasciclin domain-containing protein [Chitinophaga silvatica]|uniref:Fasciclin domain-containing protein n=1 Tax=Chitinophaga silvatica TaxID=2282649 RepID=A0A3E1Y8I5_9BACT|nr:fasciclin domain-containing protein [Chitinophaga silvatica]RFS21713.1 fasciclin domain-containing protein [Chitinophaga silvatica]